jgi:DNA-binding NarL/FixJ family response regulator
MTSVLVVDDQALVRAGFRMILEAQEDIEIVGEADNGRDALTQSRELRPDVVLMDIRMPVLDGIAATREIVAARLPSRVLVLTTFDDEKIVYDAMKAGASGFLLKTAPPARLTDAVRTVAAGEALLAPTITRRLIEEFVSRPAPGHTTPGALDELTDAVRTVAAGEALLAPTITRRLIEEFVSRPAPGHTTPGALDELTDRERDVLKLIARGLSNAEIAEELFVTDATVKTHVNHLLQKLNLRDRVQAVVLAYETGLVRPGHK